MAYYKDTIGVLHYLSPQDILNGGILLLPAGCVAITDAQATVIQNPVPTAEQSLVDSAEGLMAAGLSIISTGTPTLSGTYSGGSDTIALMNSEVTSILLNGVFTDGTSAINWQDISGASHVFSVAQFKTLVTALVLFVSGIQKCLLGSAGATLPSASATIP